MEDVVGSVFDLMGRTSDPLLEEEVISERVDTIFEVCFNNILFYEATFMCYLCMKNVTTCFCIITFSEIGP